MRRIISDRRGFYTTNSLNGAYPDPSRVPRDNKPRRAPVASSRRELQPADPHSFQVGHILMRRSKRHPDPGAIRIDQIKTIGARRRYRDSSLCGIAFISRVPPHRHYDAAMTAGPARPAAR